jgi:hypothetical protein
MPNHQTLHKEIKANFLKLYKHSKVKKIVIGPYENCRHRYSPGSIVWQKDTVNGFRLKGYDGSGIYRFYLYLNNKDDRVEVKNYLTIFQGASNR